MKCQILFSGKNNKNIISLSSVEFACSCREFKSYCGRTIINTHLYIKTLKNKNYKINPLKHQPQLQQTTFLFYLFIYFFCFEENKSRHFMQIDWLIVLGFNDTSTLVGHFVSSPREREKSDRRDSQRDEREEQGRKRNRNESEETEEIKTFPLYPNLLQG